MNGESHLSVQLMSDVAVL